MAGIADGLGSGFGDRRWQAGRRSCRSIRAARSSTIRISVGEIGLEAAQLSSMHRLGALVARSLHGEHAWTSITVPFMPEARLARCPTSEAFSPKIARQQSSASAGFPCRGHLADQHISGLDPHRYRRAGFVRRPSWDSPARSMMR